MLSAADLNSSLPKALLGLSDLIDQTYMPNPSASKGTPIASPRAGDMGVSQGRLNTIVRPTESEL